MITGLLLLIYTFFGHWHRHDLEHQTRAWFDGTEYYQFERLATDSFQPKLYEQVSSVKQAVDYITQNFQPIGEEQKIRAVFEFTRQRYLHMMYPHHTLLTNPYLALTEKIFPEKSFNQMALADDKLRHSAVASCSHAANTFVEIYRAMGGEAQLVSFQGHDLAEAKTGNNYYLVDADLEVLAEGRVAELAKDEQALRRIYQHHKSELVDYYISVFSTQVQHFGYDGPVSNSMRIYRVQQILAYVKWILPLLLILPGFWLFFIRPHLAADKLNKQLPLFSEH